MRHIRKVMLIAGLFAAAMAATGSAHAVVVTIPFTGVIEAVELSDNPLGLNVGDGAVGSVTFDTDALDPNGVTKLSLDSGAPNALSFAFGPLSFTETDDFSYGFGFPKALFDTGYLYGFDFVVAFNYAGRDLELDLFPDEFDIIDTPTREILARGRIFVPIAVPAPAAAILLIGGIAAAAAFRARR